MTDEGAAISGEVSAAADAARGPGRPGIARAPTTYAVRARASASGGAQADAGTETILFDASWGTGPSGLPGPAELLATAFAACLLKNLARARQFLSFHYERAEVDVIARRQDTPPKFTEISYDLRLVTSEPQRRIDLLHYNLRRYGTVYNTLASACDVHGRVAAVQPPDAPADPSPVYLEERNRGR